MDMQYSMHACASSSVKKSAQFRSSPEHEHVVFPDEGGLIGITTEVGNCVAGARVGNTKMTVFVGTNVRDGIAVGGLVRVGRFVEVKSAVVVKAI